MITSFLIAIGLNFDTFSVSVVEGSQFIKPSIKDSLKVGVYFGIGQAGMALLGVILGLGFKLIITNIDHWIAFLLLSLIGGKLIHESLSGDVCDKKKIAINFHSLAPLVIATSIDAAAVGITLAFINASILSTIAMIGIITFCVAFLGFYEGYVLRKFCKNNVKIIGGAILISIGIKILIEHLFFGG
ncbi:MAG: manganese efflux pump MntP family protein [Candidatus Roizmanbacteria bacterium]|nr:manganese efflux pump MntP family protein [Candidatus Roizmanbacteria bacterium]